MGYSRGAPERELNEPHHQQRSFVLKAKRDLLGEVARMYAHGTASMDELVEMAEEYSAAALALRLHERDEKRRKQREKT